MTYYGGLHNDWKNLSWTCWHLLGQRNCVCEEDARLTPHGFAQVQFVDHFSGCQLCTQQSKDKGAYRECEAEFLRSYEFASGALRELEPPPAPRNATHFKQLAATPYCLVPSLS